MVTFELFMMAVILCSVLTSLTCQGVKKIAKELGKKYYTNLYAGIIAVIIAVGVSLSYLAYNKMQIRDNTVIILSLAFMSWLVAMNGYDKVIQAIKQVKK